MDERSRSQREGGVSYYENQYEDEFAFRSRLGGAEGGRRHDPFLFRVATAVAGALFTLAITAAVFLVLGSRVQERRADGLTETGGSTSVVAATTNATGTPVPTATSSNLVAIAAPASGTYVMGTLKDGTFTLTGIVPNDQIAGSLNQAVQVAYAPNVVSKVVVDGKVPLADWLGAGPKVVALLATATEGTVLLANGRIELSLVVPSKTDGDRIQALVAKASGLPLVTRGVSVTGLEPPSLHLVKTDGPLTLSGRLPNAQIRSIIVNTAKAVYGDGVVSDQLAVDNGVYTALWMNTADMVVKGLSLFPEYDLQVLGNSFTGLVRGGYTFEPGSPTVVPAVQQVLQFGIGVLIRDPSLQLVVEGHTDGNGDPAGNLALSQKRAQSVVDLYIAAGIDPHRLTAVGKGDTVPLASNDTPDGRARNRRIEVKLSSALST